ncbi:DUF559 domain-containing protein [Pseudonocardia acidicola]|uniref:DUF559 domain-containing protein n=1 Tax=Pseudonocardia acidicola TaxID=2724939 RepID=A0ABX1SE48_9PSEU|nr:DUF559 domain-containing protein [Pseudonocardia acidicola]NMH99850.1 DUF559 domain-containing protein [Pseudonocardia acidicola]
MIPPDVGLAGACLRRAAVEALGDYRVRAAIKSGELLSPWPGVLVDPHRATEPLTVTAAAWLICGPTAVVAGPTAAFLHGCTASEPAPVHLMVPYGSRRRSRPGMVVHNGRFVEADRETVDGLPLLGLERVVTDLLCTARPPDVLAVTDQALAQLDDGRRDEFRARVQQRLAERPDPRGTRIGARLLGLATGRAESPAESRILWRIADLGFPVPEVNWWIRGPDGERLYRVDLAWPALRILVEYDGHAAHFGRTGQDESREEDLRSRGWTVVRAGADDLHDIARVERELHEAFVARGIDLTGRTAGCWRPRRHRERRVS